MLSVLKLRVFGILLGIAHACLFWLVVIAGPWVKDQSLKDLFALELLGGIVLGWQMANGMSKFPLPANKNAWLRFFLFSFGFGALVYSTQSFLVQSLNLGILMFPSVTEMGVFMMTLSNIEPVAQENHAPIKTRFLWVLGSCVALSVAAYLFALPPHFQVNDIIQKTQQKFQLKELDCTKSPELLGSEGRCFTYPSGLGDRISAYEMRDSIEGFLPFGYEQKYINWSSNSQEYRIYYTSNHLWKLEVHLVQTPTAMGDYSPEAIGYIQFNLSKR
jgi:hypothetical protein